MRDFVNQKAKLLQPSGIRKFFDIVRETEGAISLGVGEPDFVTPWKVRSAAITSLQRGYTQYTGNRGLPQLLELISKYLSQRFSLEFDPKHILITVGGSEAIDLALRACVERGDEVLVPDPAYVSYSPLVFMSDGVAVPVECKEEDDFVLKPENLEKAITPKTKAIILNSPNNPTGTMYTAEELKNIADFAIENDLLVVSDEIYEKLSYDKPHVSIASLSQEIKSRTIVINGVSKAYSMTGWRIGYAAADKKIIKKMSTMQSHITSNACSISQHAALSALVYGDQFTKDAKAIFSARRLLMLEFFKSLKDVTFPQPDGAFYMFLNVSNYYGTTYKGRKIDGSMTFADCLLDHGVAVIPGLPFGDDNSIGLSYAVSEKDILEGFIRIKDFLSQLSH